MKRVLLMTVILLLACTGSAAGQKKRVGAWDVAQGYSRDSGDRNQSLSVVTDEKQGRTGMLNIQYVRGYLFLTLLQVAKSYPSEQTVDLALQLDDDAPLRIKGNTGSGGHAMNLGSPVELVRRMRGARQVRIWLLDNGELGAMFVFPIEGLADALATAGIHVD